MVNLIAIEIYIAQIEATTYRDFDLKPINISRGGR